MSRTKAKKNPYVFDPSFHTGIEWAHQHYATHSVYGHTYNYWEGCEKVSPACKNCYAETRNKRFYQGQHWGPSSTTSRRLMSVNTLNNLKRYNDVAKKHDVYPFVFISSLNDVLEDHWMVYPWRKDLLNKMLEYDHLIYLVLTKRPENAIRFFPANWFDFEVNDDGALQSKWPKHIWFGTSVENQEWADKRRHHMETISDYAPITFVSYEPAVGDINWTHWEGILDWILAGGESGDKARLGHPQWYRNARDWAIEQGIKFHFKQWGEWIPNDQYLGKVLSESARNAPRGVSLSGEQVAYPNQYTGHPQALSVQFNVGKKKAGRRLDSLLWNQFPNPKAILGESK